MNIKIKQITAMYFSPTDTTKKIVTTVAKALSEEIGCPMDEVDFTLPKVREKHESFEASTLVIFGVPVIAGRVPNVLLKYLDTIHGNNALAVPIVCYGNRNYDDALIELRDILEKSGMHTIAAGAFIGEHSFSKVLAAGRPDAADLKIAVDFANEITKKIREIDSNIPPVTVHGETPLRPYYQPRDRKGTPVNILKVKPNTSDVCIECGLCARVCPMGSINPENVREFVGICIKCGACVKKCPTGAKSYDDEGYLYHKTELELGFERRAEPEIFL